MGIIRQNVQNGGNIAAFVILIDEHAPLVELVDHERLQGQRIEIHVRVLRQIVVQIVVIHQYIYVKDIK